MVEPAAESLGRCFEMLDELTEALNAALDYWNAHRHPYYWKKRPQEQVTIQGGFSVVPGALEIQRENH